VGEDTYTTVSLSISDLSSHAMPAEHVSFWESLTAMMRSHADGDRCVKPQYIPIEGL
jgi:hypothetical protein